MKIIYTSYYGMKLSMNFVPIQISLSAPKNYPIKHKLPELYPTWDMINGIKSGKLSYADYILQYNKILDNLNPDFLLQLIFIKCIVINMN